MDKTEGYFQELKKLLKSPELLFSILLSIIIVSFIFPNRHNDLLLLINTNFKNNATSILEISLFILGTLMALTLILLCIFNIVNLVFIQKTNNYEKRINSYSITEGGRKMLNRSTFIKRSYLGSKLRMMILSKWLVILLELILIIDKNKISNYRNEYINAINNRDVLIVVFFFLLTIFLVISMYIMIVTTFNKYIYLHHKED